VLVLTNEIQSSGRREWELQRDSLSSSDSSDGENDPIQDQVRMTEADVTDLDSIVRWSFSFNPEMRQGAWLWEQGEQSEPTDSLRTVNPEATMTPRDLDRGVALELLQVDDRKDAVYRLLRRQVEEPWFSTDMEELQRRWNEPHKGELGAKSCKH
jgi:hypothetical protein